MNKFKNIIIILLLPTLIFAQEPKREMRAIWVATVANIDWPRSSDRDDADAQKAHLIEMLDLYKETNINAVFLQVRPACDALYNSAYEPWSKYVSVSQGTYPGYDPLQFAIDEGHKRGIEIHGWVNPYRVSTSPNPTASDFHETHIFREHPEWVMIYDDGKNILNPGRPEVMSYIGDVIEDLCSNYALDGVHFDDYFYAYGGTPSALDATEYGLYNNGMSLDDWRRDNVNRMVDTVNAAIQRANPNIRFGVSPFGIWRPGYPSGISGMDAYATIYCDPLAWLEDQTVDYLTPQCYWPTGGAQDFESLVGWWGDKVLAHNRHLYPGMGTYRLSSDPGVKKSGAQTIDIHESKEYFDQMDMYSNMEQSLAKGTGDPVSAWTIGEIAKQIGIIRSNNAKNALGSVFFSAKDLYRVNGLQEYLKEHTFTHPVIVPEMTWKTGSTPSAPLNVRIEDIDMESVLLWDYTVSDNIRFAIYASTETDNANDIINDPKNIQCISFTNSIKTSELSLFENAYIVVSAISAIGKESGASATFAPSGDFPYVTIVSPGTGSILDNTSTLNWTSEYTNPTYQLQIATNNSFNNIVYDSDWKAQTSFTLGDTDLEGEKKYYWRVRVNNGTIGPFSGSRDFTTGFPALPSLTSPYNLQQNISRNPTIKWNASENTTSIRVQLSESSSFSTLSANEVFDASLGEAELATELKKDAWFYLRIAAENSYGSSEFSDFISFSTTAGEVPIVILSTPANLASAASFDMLEWECSTTEGTITFYLEVALDAAFNSVMYNSGWISEKEIAIANLNLEGDRTYFWQVKGKSEFGESEYSASRSFYAAYPTRPSITKPANLSTGINAKPIIGWNVDANTDQVYLEISEQSSFVSLKHFDTFANSSNESQITASLGAFTGYYLRITAQNEFGNSVFSATKFFETGIGTGLNHEDIQSEIQVYPSFVQQEEFFITANQSLTIDRVDIFDYNGRILKRISIDIESEIISISTEGLPHSTALLVKIYTQDKAIVKPIFIR